jgi:hypothetical protein
MTAAPRLIPLWIKIAYTAFMAVMIPVYLKNYGPTNFLYFCDVAALMTVIAIWRESPLLLSAALVGVFLPQMLWVVDFFAELLGFHLTGMTSYMFKPPYFLRFLSFFHFWLPFLLMYLVWCVGYDKRGVLLWTVVTWILLTVCYAYMPPPSPSKDPVTKLDLRNPNLPVNIAYVFGLSEEEPQKWLDPDLYFALYMMVLVAGIYPATHLLFWWLMPGRRQEH